MHNAMHRRRERERLDRDRQYSQMVQRTREFLRNYDVNHNIKRGRPTQQTPAPEDIRPFTEKSHLTSSLRNRVSPEGYYIQ